MTMKYVTKFIAEIDEKLIVNKIKEWGELENAKFIHGDPWNWDKDKEYSSCTIGTVGEYHVYVDGNYIKELEDKLNLTVKLENFYLFSKATWDNPFPVIAKINGKIYVIPPMVEAEVP